MSALCCRPGFPLLNYIFAACGAWSHSIENESSIDAGETTPRPKWFLIQRMIFCSVRSAWPIQLSWDPLLIRALSPFHRNRPRDGIASPVWDPVSLPHSFICGSLFMIFSMQRSDLLISSQEGTWGLYEKFQQISHTRIYVQLPIDPSVFQYFPDSWSWNAVRVGQTYGDLTAHFSAFTK